VTKISAEAPHVKGVQLSRNFGKESALLAGLKTARGDVVITTDADLQHPPKFIPQLLDQWRDGTKIVHAVKRDRSTDGWIVRLRARIFNSLCSRLGGIDLRNSSDFKLLDRSVVEILVRELPERERFYRGLAEWVGFKQATIYFDVDPRKDGQGKWSLAALLNLGVTATVSFSIAPLRIVTFLGALTLLFGVVVAADAVWSWFHGTAVSGFATLEISLLLLGSFIMISLGIVGEYIAKIYQEVKRRPPFIIANTCGTGGGVNEKDRTSGEDR
jgi:glycosyltransferase involved in cell wall biosynthesis